MSWFFRLVGDICTICSKSNYTKKDGPFFYPTIFYDISIYCRAKLVSIHGMAFSMNLTFTERSFLVHEVRI